MANTGAEPGSTLSSSPLCVVAAVIRRDDGAILISLRAVAAHQGGLWEFPGGKLDIGERDIDGLARELHEELGIAITRAVPLINVLHRYPDKLVSLTVMEVTQWSGTPSGREGQPVRWVRPEALSTYRFPAANLPVTVAANLPRFMIAMPVTDAGEAALLARLTQWLNGGVRLVRLTLPSFDLRFDISRRRQVAQAAVELCRAHGARLLLDGTPEEAIAVQAHGAHLNAEQLRQWSERPLSPDLLLSTSCANEVELQQAESLGVDFVLIAPVSPSSRQSASQIPAWQRLQALVQGTRLPVFAEGELQPADACAAVRAGCQGISLNRAPWDNALPAQVVHQSTQALQAAAYTTR